jgi:hypothetical protein
MREKERERERERERKMIRMMGEEKGKTMNVEEKISLDQDCQKHISTLNFPDVFYFLFR